MATDIQISELNEITVNSDINHIIVNDRESLADPGITKKIKLENLLTSNIIGQSNLSTGAVTNEKIRPLTINCSRLTCKTITCHQIADGTICNNLIETNTIDNRAINNDCGFSVKCLTVCDGPVSITSGVNGCLAVESGITKLNTLRYFWPQQQIANTFLHTDGNGNLSWQEAVPGESTSLVFREIFPVGTIIPWAGSGTTPDGAKWLPCDGASFSNIDWPDLATALGDTWGTHNGNTYYLPDLRGRVPLGSGTSSDSNGTSCNFSAPQPGGNNYGGVYSHRLIPTEIPPHVHTYFMKGNYTGGSTKGGDQYNLGTANYTTNGGNVGENSNGTGNASPHENMQPYTKVRYIIKAAKDDVQQFNPTVGPGLSAKDANGQTNTLTLTGTEIGLTVSNDFQFDGSGNLQISYDQVKENLDVGRPIQYVNNHIDTVHRYSKIAHTDLHVTELNTSITLKDTNSKVYITAMITAESYTHDGVWRLFRSVQGSNVEVEIGSNIGVSNRKTGIAAGMYDGEDKSTPCNIYIQYMDENPGAVNVSYYFKINSAGTGANYFTLNGARATNDAYNYELASSNVNLVEIGG